MQTKRRRKTGLDDYNAFAWFYDRHWAPEVFPQFLDAAESLLFPCLDAAASVLDLCCGTGQMAAELSDRGYAVTGIDSADEMLEFARANAPEATFRQADVRSVEVEAEFDAVICLFDSINHFLAISDVEAVFRTARKALKPGGLFLFDVNIEAAFQEHWEDHYSIVEDDNVCTLIGHYDRASKLAHYDITMFRQTKGVWKRTDTRIEERCYPLDEIGDVLRTAGFKKFEVRHADSDLGLDEHTGRVFFACT